MRLGWLVGADKPREQGQQRANDSACIFPFLLVSFHSIIANIFRKILVSQG
jgi:hypothetical protein